MGASDSKPSNCVDQPWWSIENETYFILKEPNLNEIFASLNEPDEIKYETVREKILAKLRDRKYSTNSEDSYHSCSTSEDQCINENQGHIVKNSGNKGRKVDTTAGSSHISSISSSSTRNNSESETNSSLLPTSVCVEDASETMSIETKTLKEAENQTDDENTLRVPQSLDEFREELRVKREARKTAVNDLRIELSNLRRELAKEREINRKLKDGINLSVEMKDKEIMTEQEKEINVKNSITQTDDDHINDDGVDENIRNTEIKFCDMCVQTDEITVENVVTESRRNTENRADTSCNCNCHEHHSNNNENEIIRSPSGNQQINLKAQLAELQLSLQLANADNLSLTTELAVIKKQVASLKEVIACSRQMIDVREEQVQQAARTRKLG